MNGLDWVLAAIVLLLGLRCLFRGFVAEILSVAAYAVGLLAAVLLYRRAGAFVREELGVETLPEVLGFAAVFLLAFLVVKLLERALNEALESSRLEAADRILGLVLGLGEGLLAATLILIVLQAQPLFDLGKLLGGSIFAKAILPIVGPEVSKALGPAALELPKLPKVELPALKKP
ncbi:MAG TPA: CvpA family protein [Spirochaetia bacterium]|nr:CvpA family protein [Spirochaetia bacterium]